MTCRGKKTRKDIYFKKNNDQSKRKRSIHLQKHCQQHDF